MWKMAHWRFASVFVAAMLSVTSGAGKKSEAAKQILNIVNNPEVYDKDIIPYPSRPGPVDVQTTVYLRGVEVDDANMRINVDLTFRMMWEDRRLSRSYPGVPSIRFSDTSKFWIPDAFFKDSYQTERMSSVLPEAYIQVSNKGNVLYSSRLRMSLRCSMDLSRFPHDKQTCAIKFASYGFTTKDIVFTFREQNVEVPVKHLTQMNRFEFVEAEKMSCSSATATGNYSCLSVNISFKRIFGTYLIEWYIPCLLLVVIAFLSEFLAASALVPRLILTVGPLLTLTTASLNYSDNMASVSYTTAFDVFTGISFLVIFASALHVIVSYYYDSKPVEEAKEDVEGEIPKWKKFSSRIRAKGDYIARVAIIGFYGAFIFLYFLAYALS